MRSFPLETVIIRPATRFFDSFPKSVVPVYILSPRGGMLLLAIVKDSKATTSTVVMRKSMPTVIAANPTHDSHGIVHYSEGPIIQIASFYPPKTREQVLERYLKKAEDVTAFEWMLTDPKRENFQYFLC